MDCTNKNEREQNKTTVTMEATGQKAEAQKQRHSIRSGDDAFSSGINEEALYNGDSDVHHDRRSHLKYE